MEPNVFVSSTYVDLKYVREHIAKFISDMGYKATLFERGGIGFDWQKAIDESCYESVEAADMLVLIIGGRYGSPATSDIKKAARKYDSVTKREYLKAKELRIPIFIFIDQEVMSEYRTYKNNSSNKAIKYHSVDSLNIFDMIGEIYKEQMNNYVKTYSSLSDITDHLKNQWASMMRGHIKERIEKKSRNMVKMNSFKMFYFRDMAKISTHQLADAISSTKREINRLEKIKVRDIGFDGYHLNYFPTCEFVLLEKIEKELNCLGKLRAGLYDDFLALYVEYYNYRSKKRKKLFNAASPGLPFQTKVLVLDFDGTITRHPDNLTTWEMIWLELGYELSECTNLHNAFRRGELKHTEWCAKTRDKFKDRDLDQKIFFKIADTIKIVEGFNELVEYAISRDIKLYILSGSIDGMIRHALKESAKYFTIQANDLIFGPTGRLHDIRGTNFDFQGKADYLKKVVEDNSCSPMDVLFVGNAGNDRWAANAGVRTLCVNPLTDPDNPKEWSNYIKLMTDMRQIINFI